MGLVQRIFMMLFIKNALTTRVEIKETLQQKPEILEVSYTAWCTVFV